MWTERVTVVFIMATTVSLVDTIAGLSVQSKPNSHIRVWET